MKNSLWERYDTREMIVSGILGWERKHQRRVESNMNYYRSAASTQHPAWEMQEEVYREDHLV